MQTQQLQAIASLCRQHQIVALYLFGSRAKMIFDWLTAGEARAEMGDSDLDVGVKVARNQPFSVKQKVRLAQALEDLLKVSRVDLVSLDEAGPFLAANIIRGERLYAAVSRVADEYELYVLRRAGDLAPFERARRRLIVEGDPSGYEVKPVEQV